MTRPSGPRSGAAHRVTSTSSDRCYVAPETRSGGTRRTAQIRNSHTTGPATLHACITIATAETAAFGRNRVADVPLRVLVHDTATYRADGGQTS